MKSTLLTTGVAVVAAFAIGLGWSWWMVGSQEGGVAVVDLDEVARRLGRDNEMNQSFQGQAQVLNQELMKAQQSAVSQLESVRQKLGEEPTNDEAKQFLRMRNSAQVQLTQLQEKAKILLNSHRQQLVSQFREDAKPFAARVAQDRGLSTVFTRNDSVVFHVEDAVDITEDVVKLMSAEMPAKPASRPAAAPVQQAQATQKAPAQTASAKPAVAQPASKPAQTAAKPADGETATK